METVKRAKAVGRWAFGLAFVVAGINHLANSKFYVSIMPPYLPWHNELVYISGLAEIGLGTLLLISRTTVLAAWGLVALLIAVFPANVHMAMHANLYPFVSPTLLWLRLPLQGLLIALALSYTRTSKPANN